MAAKLGFVQSQERAVSCLCGPKAAMEMRSGAKSVLGTFAFYIKGRRASPPKEETAKQADAERPTLKSLSPIKAQRSKTVGIHESPSQPVHPSDQSEQASPQFKVLLVEDNLVNRRDLSTNFDPPALIER